MITVATGLVTMTRTFADGTEVALLVDVDAALDRARDQARDRAMQARSPPHSPPPPIRIVR